MILHSEENGKGNALVLIHGYCEDLFIWDGFTERLSSQYRVIALDLPGFGKSAHYAQQPSIDDWARDVAETLDSLGVGDCAIVGHSLGGYVALAFARLFPDRLKGLGLFHSTAFADDEAKRESRAKVAAFVRTHGTSAFLNGLFASLFAPFNREKFKVICDMMTKHAESLAPEAIAQAALLMANRPDSLQVLENIAVPVLFVIGKHDQAIPFEKSQAQCLVPAQAWVCALESVGHMGMLEAKETTLQAVEGFLKNCI